MYSRVLVCVDGSEAAETAARSGLDLARTFGATVDALHVVQRGWLRPATGAADRLRERGRAALDEVESAAEGVEVRTELREGRPAERISAFARERDADLVVVGRQGLTGIGERLLGGVAERLLHRCSVPVLVVPDVGPGGYGRVLLPTDGSPEAAAAAPHAGAVAGRYGSVVHVLNVVDLQAAGGLFDAGGLDRAFVERLEQEGRDAVEALASGLRGDGLETETAVRRAPGEGAAAGISEYVVEGGVDLVAMGTRGRSDLGRGVLGSVTSAVLRTVDVPVLAVPP